MKAAGVILYIAIIGTYAILSINIQNQWRESVNQWRQHHINQSPTVCITIAGNRYHRCYHYRGRNIEISLFEAVEKGFTPCGTCRPQPIPIYKGKPEVTPFIFKNWIIISIIFSVGYWLMYWVILRKRINMRIFALSLINSKRIQETE